VERAGASMGWCWMTAGARGGPGPGLGQIPSPSARQLRKILGRAILVMGGRHGRQGHGGSARRPGWLGLRILAYMGTSSSPPAEEGPGPRSPYKGGGWLERPAGLDDVC